MECDFGGTRLAVFVPGVPRGVPLEEYQRVPLKEDQQFPAQLRLFFGNREVSMGAIGTVDVNGDSTIEAILPDPDRFFADLAQQGRLVAVTFAGRTKAPAPAADLISDFRRKCPARS